MKRSVQFLACIGLALVHTQLINSAPSAGEVLSALPTRISHIFDDPLIDLAGMSANEIAVRDASGHEIAIGVPNTEGVKVSVALPVFLVALILIRRRRAK